MQRAAGVAFQNVFQDVKRGEWQRAHILNIGFRV